MQRRKLADLRKGTMSKRLVDRIPFKKIVTVLAIIGAISVGLCGFTAIFSSDSIVNFVGIPGLVAFWVSIAGLLLTLLVYVTLSIFGGSEEKVSQSVIPREQQDDKRNDKSE